MKLGHRILEAVVLHYDQEAVVFEEGGSIKEQHREL